MEGCAEKGLPVRHLAAQPIRYPEARHGHKSRNRNFDGFKTHLSLDPDSELIDEVAVSAGNVSDRDPIDELLAPVADLEDKPTVYGDCAYADGDTLDQLEGQGFEVRAKVPPAANKQGRFSKAISASTSRTAR